MARPRRAHGYVVDLVERGPDAGEETGAEPDEGGHRHERDLAAALGDAGKDALDQGEGIGARRGIVRGKEAVEELVGISLPGAERRAGGRLRQRREPDEQQKKERDRGEQCVERQRTREERHVVFVGGLERAEEEAAGAEVPAPARGAAQASGSSTSTSAAPAARRRARASARRRSSSWRAPGCAVAPRAAWGRESGSSSTSSSSSSVSSAGDVLRPANCWLSSSSFSSVMARSFQSLRCSRRRVSSPLRGA